MNTDRISRLEAKVAGLKESMPAHSLKPGMMAELEKLEEQLQTERKRLGKVSFNSYAIVACGTLSPELNYLKRDGFLDAKKILFTRPGRHENYRELESSLIKQIRKGKEYAENIIVVYGGKYCYVNSNDPCRSIDDVIAEQGRGIYRINASHCVDMLAGRNERDAIARGKGESACWLTPGWLMFRNQVYEDRDKGFAVENFPAHKYTEGAIVLDGIGFFDSYSVEHAEEVLDFSDWMGLPVKAHKISLNRFKNLLLDIVKHHQ